MTELGVRAYAGVPLITPDGHAVGSLCVIDFVCRDWTDDRLAVLADLAAIAMDEIRLVGLDRQVAFEPDWQGVAYRSTPRLC